MTNEYLDSKGIWIYNLGASMPNAVDYVSPFIYSGILGRRIRASGIAGASTITVDTSIAASFGTTSSKIWSLITNCNEHIEVASVDTGTGIVTLTRPLKLGCISALYLEFKDEKTGSYVLDLLLKKVPYRLIRVTGTQLSYDVNSTWTQDNEKVSQKDLISRGGKKVPTSFLDSGFKYSRSFSITGYLTSDRRKSAEQYKQYCWNLVRGGHVQVYLPFYHPDALQDFIIDSIELDRESDSPKLKLGTSEVPSSGDYTMNRHKIIIQLTYAPNENNTNATKGVDNEYDQFHEENQW
jgi:hypothetical protein